MVARRTLAGLGLCLGVGLGAGVVLFAAVGVPRAVHAVDTESAPLSSLGEALPAYPGTHLVRMGRAMAQDGRPRRMAWADTWDTPETVVADYTALWRRLGLAVESHPVPGGVIAIANAAESRELFSVLAVEIGEVSEGPEAAPTRMILSKSDKLPERPAIEVEPPRDCSNLGASSAADSSGDREVALWLCAASAESVETELSARFGPAVRREGQVADQRRLDFRDSETGTELRLLVRQEEAEPPRLLVALTFERVGGGEDPGEVEP